MLIVVAAVFSLPVRAMISQTLTINSPANDDDEYPDNPHTHNDPENRLDLYAGPYLVPVSTPWLLLLSVIAICQELQKRLDAHAFPFDDNNSIVTTIFPNMVGPFTVPLAMLLLFAYRLGLQKAGWAVMHFCWIRNGLHLVQYFHQMQFLNAVLFYNIKAVVTTIFQNMVGPFTVPLWTLTFCLYRSGFHKTAWAVKIFWCIWDGMPLVQYLVQNA